MKQSLTPPTTDELLKAIQAVTADGVHAQVDRFTRDDEIDPHGFMVTIDYLARFNRGGELLGERITLPHVTDPDYAARIVINHLRNTLPVALSDALLLERAKTDALVKSWKNRRPTPRGAR